MEANRWYKVEVLATEWRFVVSVDGKVVAEANDDLKAYRSGGVGLQRSFATQPNIQFRNIEIKELESKESPAKKKELESIESPPKKKKASITILGSEEYSVLIKRVDGDRVTYQRTKQGEKSKGIEMDGGEITLPLAKEAKIGKALFDKERKKFVIGKTIEGGLKNDIFKADEKGVRAGLIVDLLSDGNARITYIFILGR